MKIGFTGTRNGMTQKQCDAFQMLIMHIRPKEFHHGDCVGSDAGAHLDVRKCSPFTQVHIHPPNSTAMLAGCRGHVRYEPRGYLERNQDIVNACNFLIATPEGRETQRSGTWATIRYARKIGKPVIIIDP